MDLVFPRYSPKLGPESSAEMINYICVQNEILKRTHQEAHLGLITLEIEGKMMDSDVINVLTVMTIIPGTNKS